MDKFNCTHRTPNGVTWLGPLFNDRDGIPYYWVKYCPDCGIRLRDENGRIGRIV